MLDQVEHGRRLTAKEKVLAFLQAHGEATNLELNKICFRYGARLFDLKKEGFSITKEPGKGRGVFRYVYHGRAVPDPRLPFEKGYR